MPPNSGNETGFTVERSTDGSDWQLVTTVAANATNYTDADATWNTRYYRVEATSPAGPSSYAFATSQVGPGQVGFWQFGESAGSTAAVDSSGFGNTAALQVGATLTPSGHNGNGLTLDGRTGYVAVPDAPSLNPTSQMTLAAWVNALDWIDARHIIEKGSDGADDQYRLTEEGGKLTFAIAGVGSVSSGLPSTGAWHHIAATYDGSQLRLYVDAQFVAATNATGAIPATSGDLAIGGHPGDSSELSHFRGMIDDVDVENVALTAEEVTTLADTSPPAIPSNWSEADVGSPDLTGSASYAAGTWTVAGGGADIAGNADQFHFVYQDLVGDGSIVASLGDMSNDDAKAGVMFRDGTSAGAAFAAVVMDGVNGVAFEWRDAGGSTQTVDVADVRCPVWVKLARAGNDFSALYSFDGTSWTQIDTTRTLTMATTANVGLVVSGRNAAPLASATFADTAIVAAHVTPGAPINVVATAAGPHSVDLSWSNSSTGQTGIQVFASTDGSTYTQIGTAAGDATSFTATDLLSSQTYHFRLRAAAGPLVSADSAVATVTTPFAPNVPSGLIATFVSGSEIDLGPVSKQ